MIKRWPEATVLRQESPLGWNGAPKARLCPLHAAAGQGEPLVSLRDQNEKQAQERCPQGGLRSCLIHQIAVRYLLQSPCLRHGFVAIWRFRCNLYHTDTLVRVPKNVRELFQYLLD